MGNNKVTEKNSGNVAAYLEAVVEAVSHQHVSVLIHSDIHNETRINLEVNAVVFRII